MCYDPHGTGIAITIFLLRNVSHYGKDAGKLWLVKYRPPLRAKLMALLFPLAHGHMHG